MEIITYWNGEELSYVLNAISSLMNSLDFASLLKTISYTAVMVAFMMGVTGLMKQEDWPKYVAVMVVFIYVMTGPRSTVTITDQSVSMPATVVGGVPMPLAWIGSTTSGIGAWLTTAVETVFQVLPPLTSGNVPYPPELSFTGGGGPLFGHRIIQESGMLSINSPVLSQDMMSFYRECVIPDINTGYLNVNDLNTTSNIWSMLNDTNPARYVTIHYYDSGTGKWAWDASAINCQQAYARLTGYLNSEATTTLHQLGRRMNYKSNQAAAESMIVGQLQSGYGAMLGISANAVDIVKQKMMTNFIREASYKIPAMSGDPASTQIGLAQAQAEAQYASSSLTMRKVAEGLLPKVRNIIEALIYALFPILVIYVIMAGHNALKPLAMYLKLAVWIQLWPMLYAIMNFFTTFGMAKQWQAETLGNGLAMQYSALIHAGAASDMSVAGMMISMIPAIAWMLASGSVYAATQVATGMMQPANSAASSAGSQAALGNIGMGNTNLNSASTDKYDMSPNISTGTMSMRGGNGSEHNFTSSGGLGGGGDVARNDGFRMNNLSANASQEWAAVQTAQKTLTNAEAALKTSQESYQSAIGSNSGTSYDFASNASNMQSFTKGMGKDESNEFAKGAQSYQSSADSIAKSLGIDSAQAKQLMASTGFGWNGGWLPGLEAKVNGSAQYSQAQKDAFNQATTGENGKKLDEASRWAEKVNQNSGWSDVAQHGNTASKKIASGVMETRARASAVTAAKSNVLTAQQALSDAESSAVKASFNDNIGRNAGNAKLQGFLEEGQKIAQRKGMTDPGDIAYFARQYAGQKTRDWVKSMGGSDDLAKRIIAANENPGVTIEQRHKKNVGSVDAAGDPTALANNAKGLYEGEMGTAQAKVNAGMQKLDKDVNGMKQRVDSFRASTGKDMDAKQTEALKAAEAAGLITFDDKSGKYTINDPDMGKNIDKAATEVSDLTGGKVTPEQVKDVVGTLAAARTGAVLGKSAGTVVGGTVARTVDMQVLTGAAGGIAGFGAGGAALGGAGGGNHNGSGTTTALPDGRTFGWNGDVPVVIPAQTGSTGQNKDNPTVTTDPKNIPDGYSDAGGLTLSDAGNNKPLVTNNTRLAPVDGKRIDSMTNALTSMLGGTPTTGNGKPKVTKSRTVKPAAPAQPTSIGTSDASRSDVSTANTGATTIANGTAQAAQPLETSQVHADVPAAAQSSTQQLITGGQSSTTAAPESKVDAKSTPAADAAQLSTGTANAQPAQSSQAMTTAGDNTNRPDVSHNQGAHQGGRSPVGESGTGSAGQASVTPGQQATQPAKAFDDVPAAPAQPTSIGTANANRSDVSTANTGTSHQASVTTIDNGTAQAAQPLATSPVHADVPAAAQLSTGTANIQPAQSSQSMTTAGDNTNRRDVSTANTGARTQASAATVENGTAQAPQPLTTSQVYSDVPAAATAQSSTQNLIGGKSSATAAPESKVDAKSTPAVDAVQPSTGTANAQPAQSSQAMTTAGDNTNRPDINHNQSAHQSDRAPVSELASGSTTQPNVNPSKQAAQVFNDVPTAPAQPALSGTTDENRSDVSTANAGTSPQANVTTVDHGTAQAAQPLTTSQVHTDVPATPQSSIHNLTGGQSSSTAAHESKVDAKATSTTPTADSALLSTGTANAQPAQSSQAMTTAGDNTNRPDINHNQGAGDRGAQTEVRTVETQTQVNTIETQHHTNTITQKVSGSAQSQPAPKVGSNQTKNANAANKGDKPDVS